MKHFSEFSESYKYTIIKEGTIDIFTGKDGDSSKCSSLLQMFKMAFLNVATGKRNGNDTEKTNLSKREQQQIRFAKELADHADTALKNELKHEEDLEAAYEELAHKQKMAELNAEEARKKYERAKELAAVKTTIAKLDAKTKLLKTMSGGPSDGPTIDKILVQMQEISNGVLPAEKKLMDNIRGVVFAACYDKDGKYIGDGKSIKELIEAQYKDKPEFKEIFDEIQKDPTFKALGGDGGKSLPATKEEFEKWADGIVNDGLPTTETMKNAQEEYEKLDKILSENRKKKNANEKKIENLQKEIKDGEPKIPEAVKSLIDKAGKHKDVTDEEVKSAGNALINDLQEKIIAAYEKADGENKADDANVQKYLGMLKNITGDDAITVEPNESGDIKIKSGANGLQLKDDITQKDLEEPIEELTQDYKSYKENKDQIEKLEEENKKITENSKHAIEETNEILREYDKGILDEDKKFEIKVEDGKIPENVVADKTKEIQKEVKKREKAISDIHIEAAKAHKDIAQKEKEDEFKKYDEKISKDETFQKELKANLDGTSEDLYGEHALDTDKDGNMLVPTGEVDDDGNPKHVKISKKDLENPSADVKKKLDRAMYIRQASVSDDKINELLNATPTDDSDEAKLECAKKIKMGQELKKAKLHAVGELEKEVTDANGNIMFKPLSSEDLEKFHNAEKDYNPEEDWDDDTTDTDMDDDEKTERKNKIKDAEELDDEEKENKAKEDLEKAKKGDINPATVFKGGRDKRTGKRLKTMKHIYNDKYRISRKEYNEMIARYKEKKSQKAKKDKEGEDGQSESLQIKSLRGFIRESLR